MFFIFPQFLSTASPRKRRRRKRSTTPESPGNVFNGFFSAVHILKEPSSSGSLIASSISWLRHFSIYIRLRVFGTLCWVLALLIEFIDQEFLIRFFQHKREFMLSLFSVYRFFYIFLSYFRARRSPHGKKRRRGIWGRGRRPCGARGACAPSDVSSGPLWRGTIFSCVLSSILYSSAIAIFIKIATRRLCRKIQIPAALNVYVRKIAQRPRYRNGPP